MRTAADSSLYQVSFQLSHNCQIVSFSGDFNTDCIKALISRIMNACHAQKSTCGVILDFSGVDFVDSECFMEFEKLARMIRVMGQKTVMSGLKAGIISSLVDFELELSGIITAVTLEDAYLILGPRP